MELQVTRNTGFYGMGSAIELTKNGQKWLMIQNNQTTTIEIEDAEMTIQVKFFFLKSNKKIIKNTGNPVHLEITMNPKLILSYVLFFLLMLVIPTVRVSIIGGFLLFSLYFVFLFSMLNKAYVIKEKYDGPKSGRISE